MESKGNDMFSIPFVIYESDQCRHERTVKRLALTIVLTIVLLFVSNGLWLYAWMQYDYESETTDYSQDYWQDGNGYNNINTGEQGDVINGAETDDNTTAPSETAE